MSFLTPKNKLRTAVVTTVAGLAVFLSPMVSSQRTSVSTIDVAEPLKPEAVRRGAFNNSGSRDIGPDPNWQNGVWKPSGARNTGKDNTSDK